MAVEAAGLYLDFSKNRVTEQTLNLLLQLARQANLGGRIAAMFGGDRINVTENRSVLHVALRAPKSAVIMADGKDVVPEVHAVLGRMSAFSKRVRNGDWKGHTGKPIRNIINVGIGGSDLGPVMAYEALRHYSDPGLGHSAVACTTPRFRGQPPVKRNSGRPAHSGSTREADRPL